ncbi:uncharacterized protein LOC116251538 [Nymphaea colorata]|uniref:uncharacterized protein LOC116251538 n=1 Tax=Nymphaea colorata TaxID=210225 RepID=UPI00129D2FA1|nr:uncharacterized protein LOC116251538 [Nymphaea colorata]
MSQVPMESLHAVVKPAVISDFSNAIPMQSYEHLDSSSNVWPEKMIDGGLDSNENLSPLNESPVLENELNPGAGGSFTSNKPVVVFTMTYDSIGGFGEIDGGEQLSLSTEIDMELGNASLCTEGYLDLADSCSGTLSEEVSDQGICENGKLLPHEESHIQENELNLDTKDQRFASNKSATVVARMDEDMPELHINNGNHSLAVDIGAKLDDKNLCGKDVCCEDEVDFGYQHVNLNRGYHVQALEVASHSDKGLVDAAETFPDDDLIMPVVSSRFGFDNNSKSESLMTSDHVEEGNIQNMVEAKSSVPEEHCLDHENCGIDKELEEQCKHDSLLVDKHVQGKVFDDELDLEVVEVNYDHCRHNGDSKVDERDKETQNAVNIHHQSTSIENQIADGVSKMPLVMPQPGKLLMEDTNTRTFETVSFEALNVLESSLVESSSGMKSFTVQHETDILFDDGDQHIDVAREIGVGASAINMLQNSDLCPTDQVEVQTTSAILDEKFSEVNMLEESRPFDDLCGLVRGFNSSPQFSSSGVGKPPETIQCVNKFSDSGHFAHSSFVEVSMMEGNAEGVGPVIVEDHTYFDQSFDPAHVKYYGSNLKSDGQANLEEADLSSDHISSFFLSDNLFTPFSYFRRRDGEIEWDPSLSTEELLQLSYSEVDKEMGLEHVPYSVVNLDESPVCGTTDTLCINLSMKEKEVDPTDLAEPGDSGNMHLADEQHETCCLTNFPFEKHGGSPITGYGAVTGEVEKDGSISSSSSSGVDERQREPFDENHSFVVYQTESDPATINDWLDRHDSVNSQDIGAEPNDTEMPRGVSEGQSGKVSKLDISEKYKMVYTVDETVATAKSDQEKFSYTDETVGSEEEIFTGSADSSASESEHHAGEHSSCDGSSPLLSSQVEYTATSSTADKQWAEPYQFTASRSAGYDFHFRGASKLVGQFDECLAKECEEIRKDEVQPEQVRADKYSDRTLTCKRASFQECCGVWDWIRGFRG